MSDDEKITIELTRAQAKAAIEGIDFALGEYPSGNGWNELYDRQSDARSAIARQIDESEVARGGT